MIARTQIALDSEMQERALQRARALGISLSAYLDPLLANDLARPQSCVDVTRVFDLGSSSASDIARDKDAMLAAAFAAPQELISTT